MILLTYKLTVMTYKVYFNTFHGAGHPSARANKANDTDDYDDAVCTAKACYGWIEEDGRRIASYEIH
jgi:hypothetical protein